ncbi:MAG TPA: hypothetical protein VK475_07920, partial [Pyrinomonadaceae bacterium]|nr:hypothetical protein [Pyrinomonadaceae bacterium]
MYCSGHFRVLLLFAAILLSGWVIAFPAFAQGTPGNAQTTQVHLRWGPQPGVARYRLQLATDTSFADILFDRVVSGNEYEVEGLDPGRYFWRIAPLTKRLGDFSSAAVIEVSKTAVLPTPTPLQRLQSGNDPTRIKTSNSIVARGG